MLKPVRVTPPAVPLLSLEEAKVHCRVDADDEDGLIEGLIAAATDHLDGWSGILGRCLVNQQWRLGLIGFPTWGGVKLPFPDVSAASVSYVDENGDEQSLDDDLFEVVEGWGGSILRARSQSQTWPAVSTDAAAPVAATITSGYGPAAEDVPAAIRQAALLMVGHWYEHRQAAVTGLTVAELPMAVDALLAPHRVVRI